MNGKQLKNSILQWAIQGKLVPQDASEEPAINLLKRFNPKIKPITEDVPFEVPKSWCWVKLGDVINLLSGRDLEPEKYNKVKKGIPYITGASNFNNGNLHINRWTEEPITISKKGDLLLTCKGTIGIMAFNDIGNIHIARQIMAISSSFVNLLYIQNFLNLNVNSLEAQANSIIPGISRGVLLKTILPLPPLAEQKRIVAKIEELMPLVERYTKAQEGLDKLNAGIKGKLRASILQEAIQGHLVPQDANEEPAIELLKRLNPKFTQPEYEGELPRGWSVATLSDICDTINGLWKGKKEPFIKVGVIRNANFTKDFKLDYSKIEYLDVEEKSFKKRNLLNGDLIVEKSGGGEKTPVGRSILYEGEDGIYSFSNFTMLLRIKDKKEIFPKYLYYFLLSKYWSGAMFDMQTNTTGLHNLLTDIYLSINVPLPPLAEQKRIVAKIEELFAVLDNGPKKDPKGD